MATSKPAADRRAEADRFPWLSVIGPDTGTAAPREDGEDGGGRSGLDDRPLVRPGRGPLARFVAGFVAFVLAVNAVLIVIISAAG